MRLPNGYGSVHKLSGNRRKPWRVRKTIGWTDEGKAIYQNVGYFKSRTEALNALIDFNRKPWEIDVQTMTFGEIYEKVLERKKDTLSHNTIKTMRSIYKHAESLSDVPIKDVKVQAMQYLLDNADVSDSMLKKIRLIFNEVYGYALKHELVDKDYSSLIEIKKRNTETKDITLFTHEEIRAVKHLVGTFTHDMTMILLCTGFRITELLTLETENVDLERGVMIGGLKTDAGRDRTVPISRHIADIVKRYHDPENRYMFPNSVGTPYLADNFRKKWRLEYPNHRFHETRHTFSSLADNAGMKMLERQRIMGHTPQNITDRVYTHKSDEDLIKEFVKFDEHLEEILR